MKLLFKPPRSCPYDNSVVNRCFLKSKETHSFAFLQKPNIFHSPFNSKDTNSRGQVKCKAPEFYSVMRTLTIVYLAH